MPLSCSTRPPRSETARVARSSDSLRACVLIITVQPSLAQARESCAEPCEALAVESGGGLVEQQQARAVQQRARDRQALAHAARKCAHQASGARSETAGVERIGDARRECARGRRAGEKT